jgi:hypothetical protein
MIIYILSLLLITAGLILVFSNQIPPIIWGQNESITENTIENSTESTEDDNLSLNGTISRKGQ